MPFSLREKIILASVVFLIVLIPISSFVIAYRFKAQTNAEASGERTLGTLSPVTKDSPSALSELQKNLGNTPIGSGSPETPSDQASVSFGPTLNFAISMEGRSPNSQAASIFLGIALGTPTQNIQYLLSFKVPVPATGIYQDLSLAGLTQGSSYTAFLKGPSQIATSAAFLVTPTTNDIGTLNMISGDLNDDNVIDNSDYAIAKAAFGTTPSSTNWNANIDLNQDNIVNNWDLTIIQKNLGKIGAGGPWYSKISQLTTPVNPFPTQQVTPVGSASAQFNITSPTGVTASPTPKASSAGYWMWIPGI